MSYWETQDVVQIKEEQVSIPNEQGLNIKVESVGRKVSFDIPAGSVEFLSGKDSYLEFDMDIVYPAGRVPTRLQLDPAGAGMICQNIRIYDGGRGNLIEELNEYNQMVAIRHDYDKDASLKGTRALMEGATFYNPKHGGTLGNSKSDMADLTTNPWFKGYTNVTQNVAYDGNTRKQSVHCCVPIHSGVFSGQIFPNMLTGLYIEIDLMPAPRIIRQLDSVVRDRRRTLNPVFYAARKAADDTVTAPWNAGNADAMNGVWLELTSCASIDECPFVVGETIGFMDGRPAQRATLNANINAGGVYQAPIISTIELREVPVANGGDGVSRVFLRFQDVTNAAAAGGRGANCVAGQTCVFSLATSEQADGTALTSYPVAYNVNNMNLVVQKVLMDDAYKAGMLQKAREGSAIEFDIFSYTNYKNSMLASDRQASFLIHCNNSRAKSAIIVPTDSTVYNDAQLVGSRGTYEVTADEMDGVLNSGRSGICGICDQLSEVQYQIDGQLVPSRPISTRKIATRKSIDAFHIYELEKTLANSGVTPHSFTEFMSNFILGRGFAVNSGVMDLRNKDFSIQLQYTETTAPTKPKMFSTFIHHLRRIVIKNGQTTVVQ
jgi:hypothetical protein